MKLIRVELLKEKEIRGTADNDYLLFMVLSGKAEFSGNPVICADKEDIVVYNPNEKYRITVKEGIVAKLSINYSKVLQLTNYQRKIIVCNTVGKNNDTVRKLKSETEKFLKSYFDTEESDIIRETLSMRVVYQLITDFSVAALNDYETKRKDDIAAYIEGNYNSDITLEDTAEAFGLTAPYFSKYFKETFNENFLKYLNRIRLSYAVEDLLNSDDRVLKIAINNGFPNVASFLREFKNRYGTAPSDYRKQHRKNKDSQLQDISQLLSADSGQNSTNTINMDVFSGRNQGKVMPYWTSIVNLHSASVLMKNGVMKQAVDLIDGLKFRTVRLNLDCYARDGRHRYYIADRIAEFIIFHQLKAILGIDFREVDNEESYIAYFRELCNRLLIRFRRGITDAVHFELIYDTNFDAGKLKRYKEFCQKIKEVLKEFHFSDDMYGPAVLAGENAGNLREFVREVKDISTYTISIAPYSFSNINGDMYMNRMTDSNYVIDQYESALKVLKEEKENAELLVVSWKDNVNEVDALHESSYMAARIVRNICSGYGKLSSLPMATPLDLMYDEMVYDRIFNLLPGILTNNEIRKPSYYAYAFLNQHDNNLIAVNDNCLITESDTFGNFEIICHNCKKLGYQYYVRESLDDSAKLGDDLFEDTEELYLNLVLHDMPEGRYVIKYRSVSDREITAFTNFQKLDYQNERFIGRGEIQFLNAGSVPLMKGERAVVGNDHLLKLTVNIPPNGIKHIHVIRNNS